MLYILYLYIPFDVVPNYTQYIYRVLYYSTIHKHMHNLHTDCLDTHVINKRLSRGVETVGPYSSTLLIIGQLSGTGVNMSPLVHVITSTRAILTFRTA